MAEAQIILRAVDQTRVAFASVQSSLSGLQRSAMSLRGMLGGIGVALSAGGLASFVKSSIDAADNLGKLSQKVGITVENLSALQYAAKLSDVSTEQLSTGLTRLAVNMQAAARGSGDAKDAFRALGISQRELAGMSADQALERIANAFAKMEDGAGKTALAVQLFGRSGAEMIPLLNSGAEGLAKYRAELERMGGLMTTDMARAAEEFNDNLTRLQTAAQGAGREIAAQLLPTLVKVSEQLAAAAKEGNLLAGVLKSVAQIGKFALFGNDPSDYQKQIAFIKDLRKEIQDTEKKLKASEGGAISRAMFGSPEELQRKLAELRLTLKQARSALSSIAEEEQRSAKSSAGKKSPAPLLPESKSGKANDFNFNGIDREGLQQLRAAYERRQEFARELEKIQTESDFGMSGSMQDYNEAMRGRVDQLLSRSPAAQIKQLERDLELLAKAGANAPLEMQVQYEQAFEAINAEMQKIKGVSDGGFAEIATTGKEAFKELEFAIQGWGRQFTDTLADAVMTGKLDFKSLADSIIRDMLRMYIQAQVTMPLMQMMGGVIPGFPVIPGRASGGPVSAGQMYMVGERGPELFIPRNSGTILPNGMGPGGGVVINQSMTFNGNADAGTLSAWARQVQASTMAAIKNDIRRGDRAYASR